MELRIPHDYIHMSRYAHVKLCSYVATYINQNRNKNNVSEK